MLNEFIKYLEGQVDRGLYVLGAQTEIVDNYQVFRNNKPLGTLKSWMKSIGQSTLAYNTVEKLYVSRIKKWGNIRFSIFDCSGLGMNFICAKFDTKDLTANGMLGKCERLEKKDLKKGDWVFRTYKTGTKKGKAHHIGYIVDDNLSVVEDYGKAKGVIKRPLDTSYWNTYGRPSYFKDEIEKEHEKVKPVFTRILKRVKPTMAGDDVKELQKLLNEVNGAELAVDGRFGALTEKAVKDFQKAKGLTVDGKVGKNTVTALGGEWRG